MLIILETRYLEKDLSGLRSILTSFCMFMKAIRVFDLYFKKIVAMTMVQIRENLEEGRPIRKILQ